MGDTSAPLLKCLRVAACAEIMSEEDGSGNVWEKHTGGFIQTGTVFDPPVSADRIKTVKATSGAIDQAERYTLVCFAN